MWANLEDSDDDPFDGEVEVDETCTGGRERNRSESQEREAGRGAIGKIPVAGASSRDDSPVRAEQTMTAGRQRLHRFVRTHVVPGSAINAVKAPVYKGMDSHAHECVNCGVCDYITDRICANAIESFWSILYRGCVGAFYHFSGKRLRRYPCEFSRRWNMGKASGATRLDTLLAASDGVRLTCEVLFE